MGKNSKIGWTNHTYNPWFGCTKIDPLCANCYAETFTKRIGNDVWGDDKPRRFFGDKHWAEPLKWDKEAAALGERHRVFCASMADVFEDRKDLDAVRVRLYHLIEDTPHLDWLLLTKRPEKIEELMYGSRGGYVLGGGDYFPNVWLGTSVGVQKSMQKVRDLLKIPAVIHFVSAEPLLEAVDFEEEWGPYQDGNTTPLRKTLLDGISWLIVGGESGNTQAVRPMNPAWARSIRDQCQRHGVKFFFKQNGEYADLKSAGLDPDHWYSKEEHRRHTFSDGTVVHRVGTGNSGALLDGREWSEVPVPKVVVAT